MSSADQAQNLLWPQYRTPDDLAAVESIPLSARGLPQSTYAALVRAATLWPQRSAITAMPDARRWQQGLACNYSQLLAMVHRYANALHRLGVRRHHTVALMSPNCAQLIPASLAAQLAGTAVPINGALATAHVADLLHRAGARVLIAASPDLAPDVWETAHTLSREGRLDAVLAVRPTGAHDTGQPLPTIAGVTVDYLDSLADGDPGTDFVGEAPRQDDLAALFHTGGTTGAPKLAAHTHLNEVADAWMIALILGALDETAAVFAGLPLFHVNALMVTVLAPMLRGQHVVWAGPLGYRDPALFEQFWRIVERYRIATMSAVPTVYEQLARSPIDADITSLRYAVVGASPLPAAVREAFQTHTAVPLLEGYGLTEATCASVLNLPAAPRPGSIGHRLPYQDLRVITGRGDDPWQSVSPGQTGSLAISGPTVFAGYVVGRNKGRPVLDTLGTVSDGWLNTGDLACIDGDGSVRLRGRVKDLIIRGGHNIEPGIIEDALLSHPHVLAAAAVGRPDTHAGEVPVAYVTVAPDSDSTAAQLQQWAASHVTERAAAPKDIVIIDAIPLTAVGKPNKLALRSDAARRELLAALSDIEDLDSVTTSLDDGAVVATIVTRSPAATVAAQAVLDRYSIHGDVVCQ